MADIYEIVEKARKSGKVEKGVNEATKAIEELNGKDVGGRAIIVKKAHDKHERGGPGGSRNNNRRRFNNSRY